MSSSPVTNVRYKPDKYALLVKAAERRGMTISDYIRSKTESDLHHDSAFPFDATMVEPLDTDDRDDWLAFEIIDEILTGQGNLP